ncbi:MAG TPA: Ig-like domain-containing protein, partial [Roseiflexaceae bacterium]|nr:Ig-like domain-containing protein [Roseiflexaceae bacterium]
MRTPGTRRWQLITHLIALIALALGQIVGSTVAPTGVAYAAAPEINVQPLTASFGAQEVGGTSAAQTVTIQNTGDAALSVSGISLGGADAGMFAAGGTCGSTFPLTVVAGGSCTVLLTFHPTSMGARSASLTLASDDGDEPAVAVALSGTGVDTTPPAAPVISSPAAGSSTSITIPTFRGTAEPGSTVTIIDGSTTLCSAVTDAGGVWACAPSTPMAPGNHSVSASAVDAASNTSPASPSVAFTIDTTPPNTAITIKPFNPSDSTNATIEFTGSDNLTAAGSLTFECQLDVVTWTSCSSPATYTSLSQGSHTFRVRARDAAGSVDTTPASYTWVVDTVPPAMPTIGTPAITSDRTPMIIGTAEPSSALVVELDLNSNGAADITYSVTSDGSGSWTIDTATAVPVIGGFPGAGLMDGSIQLSATVYDSAGNPSTT